MHITVDASEWDAVTIHLKSARGQVGARAAVLVRSCTQLCQGYAIAGAPVDTGFLRSSITGAYTGDGRFGAMWGEVTAEAGYSYWVEHGTSRMAAQPFMGPALARTTPTLVSGAASIGVSLLGGGGRR